jgi:hypothetical protein
MQLSLKSCSVAMQENIDSSTQPSVECLNLNQDGSYAFTIEPRDPPRDGFSVRYKPTSPVEDMVDTDIASELQATKPGSAGRSLGRL